MSEGEWEEFQTVQTKNLFDLTISGNTAGAGQLVSSGTLTLVGGTNITLSQAGNVITILGAAGTGSAGIGGIAASNTTYTSGTIIFAGSDIITVKTAAGQSIIIDATTTPQSVQTQNLFDLTLSGNTAGVLALVSSGTLTLAGGQSITLSQVGNAITISGNSTSQSIQSFNIIAAGTQTANTTGTVVFSNSNNITFGMTNNSIVTATATFSQSLQPSLSAGISTDGNTAGTSGTVSQLIEFVGGNSITLSQSVNANSATITIIGATTSQSVQPSLSAGVSTGGNTLGTTGTVSNQLILVGSNNITLSESINANSATVSISANPPLFAGMSNLGNTSGTTGLVTNQLAFAGINSITLSQATNLAGATISISGQKAIRFVNEIALGASVTSMSIGNFVSSNRVATLHVFISNSDPNNNLIVSVVPIVGAGTLVTAVQTRVGISQSDGGGPGGIGDQTPFVVDALSTQVGWGIINVLQTSNMILFNGQVWDRIPGGGVYFPHNVLYTVSNASLITGFALSCNTGALAPNTRMLLYVGEN